MAFSSACYAYAFQWRENAPRRQSGASVAPQYGRAARRMEAVPSVRSRYTASLQPPSFTQRYASPRL